MTDLFGNEIKEPRIRITPSGKKRRVEVAKGYAGRPGSGPQGETCKTCQHAVRRSMSKNYWKCALMRHCWSGCVTTDIRLRTPACSQFVRHQPCTDCAAPLTSSTEHIIYEPALKDIVYGLCSKCFKKRKENQK